MALPLSTPPDTTVFGLGGGVGASPSGGGGASSTTMDGAAPLPPPAPPTTPATVAEGFAFAYGPTTAISVRIWTLRCVLTLRFATTGAAPATSSSSPPACEFTPAGVSTGT